jgi:hypothetical protein
MDQETSEWSDIVSFTVDFGDIMGQNPPDGAQTPDNTPLLQWDPSNAAVGYDVQMSTNPSSVVTQTPVSVTNNQHEVQDAQAVGTILYWRVRAEDANGITGNWSTTYSVEIVPYQIGDTGPAGGIVFYDKGSYSDGWRYMEVAQQSYVAGGHWGPTDLYIGTTGTAIGTGRANTEAMRAAMPRKNDGSNEYMAHHVHDLVYGGYSDWFVPSKDELNLVVFQNVNGEIGGLRDDMNFTHWSSSEVDADSGYPNYQNLVWTQGINSPDLQGGVAHQDTNVYYVAIRYF